MGTWVAGREREATAPSGDGVELARGSVRIFERFARE